VLPGKASEVGKAIVEHPDVPYLTFTGSPDVGWGLKEQAPRKKVGLELGNNAPVIIEADGDYVTAAQKISVAGFSHAGQSCISTQRVYVHADVADAFLADLVPRVEALVVGDPMDEKTDVSALISTSDRDRVHDWIEEAVSQGAKVATGSRVEGVLLYPTVLTDVTPDMRVSRDEVFGPVVTVQTYTDVAEALRLANDTRYGLQAAIFTTNLTTAMGAARTLDFGGVLVNEVPTWRADQMPYGGTRDSGNTREGPAYAVREMTETRLVVIQT
jgi:acyl-CoA reductase-like NAD-dependent aldehyde dehydrogenase